MGANAQTSVPAFTSGQVLTAAQVTQINTGIPVFASSTERDAAFGGTGEKTLAEGQMAYLEDTNVTQVYDGSAWIGSSGLVLVSRTTIGSAVTSVTVSGAFSTEYDNYKILVSGGTGTTDANLGIQLGATSSGYHMQLLYGDYANSALGVGNAAESSFPYVGSTTSSSLNACIELQAPFLTENTFVHATRIRDNAAGVSIGYLADTTSYTAFTLSVNTGTITGGHIDVYGYAKA